MAVGDYHAVDRALAARLRAHRCEDVTASPGHSIHACLSVIDRLKPKG